MALDLDGTVLSPAGHVTPRTRDAIRAVTARGIRVCICTGRTWSESRAVAAEGRYAAQASSAVRMVTANASTSVTSQVHPHVNRSTTIWHQPLLFVRIGRPAAIPSSLATERRAPDERSSASSCRRGVSRSRASVDAGGWYAGQTAAERADVGPRRSPLT